MPWATAVSVPDTAVPKIVWSDTVGVTGVQAATVNAATYTNRPTGIRLAISHLDRA